MTFLCVCLKCGYNITSEIIDTNHICNNVSDKAASFGKCLITIAHAMGGAQSEAAPQSGIKTTFGVKQKTFHLRREDPQNYCEYG